MTESTELCGINVSSALNAEWSVSKGLWTKYFYFCPFVPWCVHSVAELKASILTSLRCLCILDASYLFVCKLCNCNRLVGKPPWLSMLFQKEADAVYILIQPDVRLVMLIGKTVRVNSLGSIFVLGVTRIGENLASVVLDWNLNENLFYPGLPLLCSRWLTHGKLLVKIFWWDLFSHLGGAGFLSLPSPPKRQPIHVPKSLWCVVSPRKSFYTPLRSSIIPLLCASSYFHYCAFHRGIVG